MVIFLAYIFYFIASSASPLQRRWLAKKKDLDGKSQVHFAFQVSFIIAVLSLHIVFFSPFYLVGDIWKIIGLTLVTGAFGAGALICSFVGQKHIEAGISSLVSNIYTPVTIVLATLFLSEKLLPLQIAGTILLLVGIVIVSKKHRIGKFKFDKYFLILVLGGVMLALDITAERGLQKITGFSSATIITSVAQCIFMGIAVLVSRSRSMYSNKYIAITGGLRFLQALSWAILVFVVGNLSLVSSITTFKVVLMFVAGAIFLGEREDFKRKLLGSIIALFGLLIMK